MAASNELQQIAERDRPKKRRVMRKQSGEPFVWLAGGSIATGILMIVAVVLLIIYEGSITFWPRNVDAFVVGKEAPKVKQSPEDEKPTKLLDRLREDYGKNELALAAMDKLENTFVEWQKRGDSHKDLTGEKLDAAVRAWREALVTDFSAWRLALSDLLQDPAERVKARERASEELKVAALTVKNLGRLVKSHLAAEDLILNALSLQTLPFDEEVRQALASAVRIQVQRAQRLSGGKVYGVPGDKGAFTPVPWLLEDDTLAGKEVLMGTVRATRDLKDLSSLPRKPDGSAWQAYELSRRPDEILVRQGNQTKELLQGEDYFRWVLRDVPDPAALERQNPGSYDNLLLRRFSPSRVAEIERLEKGVIHGWVVEVAEVTKDPKAAPGAKKETRTVLASVEKDGLEGVWNVFVERQREAYRVHRERFIIEKYDLGRVNYRLRSLERSLLRLRYDYRKTGLILAAMDKLENTFVEWQKRETSTENLEGDAFGAAVRAWREALVTDFSAWRLALSDLLQDPAERTKARVSASAELKAAALSAENIERLVKSDLAAEDLILNALSLQTLPFDEEVREALADAVSYQVQRAQVQSREYIDLRYRVRELIKIEEKLTYTVQQLDGERDDTLKLAEVVRAFRPNELDLGGRFGVYFERVWEFLTDDPREANTEGGIFPVIVGTLIMTLLMCLLVVPFGVIAALYLREYAKQGLLVSGVRIAVNNLAGVPSIVFGIFGLGLFCYVMGGTIDSIFFPEIKTPTFGGGGIMWASMTLALLTVPVVIVSTEEALISVPSSQREASLGCGASRFQTITRIILPQALPGILTGTILAMARGAGEVAPLMIVGVVKLAPDLPVDSNYPFIHLERKFMHLGFHIYDVGFQSPFADNTKSLVFATALVLMILVAFLNIFAISLRNRIRRKLASSAV